MNNLNDMLDKEFKFYLNNQDKLLEQYKGRFIVIVGEEIVGDYDNLEEAYNDSIKKHELGTFLIQQCLPGKESFTQTFHTRAVFV